MLKRRSILFSPEKSASLMANSPLITKNGEDNLKSISKFVVNKNKSSTPSNPSRSSELIFGKHKSTARKEDNELLRPVLMRNFEKPQKLREISSK